MRQTIGSGDGKELEIVILAAARVRLDTNALDYAILAIYFVVVLGVGFVARRYVKTSLDYFLSGRSLPAWITGLAFVSANLGATEILGMGANGAQYGVATVNYYWIGADPGDGLPRPGDDAVLLRLEGPVGARVPAAALRQAARTCFNSLTFALATVLIAGVNLFALALVLKLLLGWPILLGIVVAAVHRAGLHHARRPVLGDLQRGAAVLRDHGGADPADVVGLHDAGGWGGLQDKVERHQARRGRAARAAGDRRRARRPTRSARRGSASSSASASCCPSATGRRTSPRSSARCRRKDLSAGQRTPLIGAYPKLLIPVVVVIPGMIALWKIPGLGGGDANLAYNNAIPLLMNEYLPNGMLGHRADGADGVVHGGRGGERQRVQHGGDDRHHRALHRARTATTRSTSASGAS